MVTHGDVEGRALEVLRPRRATHGLDVLLAAIAGARDQRFAETVAERLHLAEGGLVDHQPPCASTSDLCRREVGPAPDALPHIALVRVEGHGVLQKQEPPERRPRVDALAVDRPVGAVGRPAKATLRIPKDPPPGVAGQVSPTGRRKMSLCRSLRRAARGGISRRRWPRAKSRTFHVRVDPSASVAISRQWVAVSSQIVTGPSFTRATFMSAPKVPLATRTPWLRTCAEKCS